MEKAAHLMEMIERARELAAETRPRYDRFRAEGHSSSLPSRLDERVRRNR